MKGCRLILARAGMRMLTVFGIPRDEAESIIRQPKFEAYLLNIFGDGSSVIYATTLSSPAREVERTSIRHLAKIETMRYRRADISPAQSTMPNSPLDTYDSPFNRN